METTSDWRWSGLKYNGESRDQTVVPARLSVESNGTRDAASITSSHGFGQIHNVIRSSEDSGYSTATRSLHSPVNEREVRYSIQTASLGPQPSASERKKLDSKRPQAAPNSFLRQIFELRRAYSFNDRPSAIQASRLAMDIGLQDFEVSIWFQTERDTRSAWSELQFDDFFESNLSRRQDLTQPTFLQQVFVLRQEFRHNSSPTMSQIRQTGHKADLHDFEVSFWFGTERGIQLDWLMKHTPIKGEVPAIAYFTGAAVTSNLRLGDRPPIFKDVKYDEGENQQVLPINNFVPPFSNLHQTPSIISLSKRQKSERKESDASTISTSSIGVKRPRYAIVPGEFPCLIPGCHSKSTDIGSWRDHQTRKHFPRQAWICWLKKSDDSPCEHGPVLRADNFTTHLVKEHGKVRGIELNLLVQTKATKIMNLFHDHCGFCKIVLGSWEESMRHIGEHLSQGDGIGEWEHCCVSKHVVTDHISRPVTRTYGPCSLFPKSIKPESRPAILKLLQKYHAAVHSQGMLPAASYGSSPSSAGYASAGSSFDEMGSKFFPHQGKSRQGKHLSNTKRARKALLRKLGACEGSCRTNKVKCSLEHHALEDLLELEHTESDKVIIQWAIKTDGEPDFLFSTSSIITTTLVEDSTPSSNDRAVWSSYGGAGSTMTGFFDQVTK